MFCRLSILSMKDAIPLFTQKTLLFDSKQICRFSKTKSQKIWMHEHITDEYVKKAQKDNYRSRSTYKLIEIQEKFKIFKQGYKVLELGSAPGGWTQVSVEFTKSTDKNPTVLAIDREHMDQVKGAVFYLGDIIDKKTQIYIPEFFKLEPVDVVTSDMAPNFSGDLETDHLLIQELNSMTIDMCTKVLKTGGSVVMKTLSGTMEKDVFNMYKIYFKEFLRVKPKASRPRSTELYYLGKGFGLSKEFERFAKIQERKEKGIDTDDEDIRNFGITDQELIEKTRSTILQMYENIKIRKIQNDLKKKNKIEQSSALKSSELKEKNQKASNDQQDNKSLKEETSNIEEIQDNSSHTSLNIKDNNNNTIKNSNENEDNKNDTIIQNELEVKDNQNINDNEDIKNNKGNK